MRRALYRTAITPGIYELTLLTLQKLSSVERELVDLFNRSCDP